MKKRSFYKSINISLLIMLITYIVQAIILIFQFNSGNPLNQIVNDSKNILFSFLILFVIYYISLMIYQPIKMKKSIKLLQHIFDEFRKGNYEYDLESVTENIEKEYNPLVESIKKMMANIIQFDKLHKVKISAHFGKIKALLSTMNDGALIIDTSGEILYVNKVLREMFEKLELDENTDFFETIYPEAFEKTVKSYVNEVISKGEKLEARRIEIPEMGLELMIKSSLYKNSNGEFLGAVFVINILDDKKIVDKIEVINKDNENKGD